MVTNLSASTAVGRAEILWDRWGVPHVYGADDAGVFHGFGWAQLHSHGDLILRLYGRARGRAAEYWGEAELASDRLMHTVGIPWRARQWYDAQSPAFRDNLDAFAAGMNAYAERFPERIAADVRQVLPVTAGDVLAHGMRVMFTFLTLNGQGTTMLIQEGLPMPPGSNAWAIGPAHSASGHSMLLANPHLPWSDLYLFYEAHLIGPSIDCYGCTLVGMPVLAIGFNEYLGWTHTVNTHDGWDAYALTLDGDGYLLDGEQHAFETQTVTLTVRGADGSLRDEPLVVRRSRHGPVIAERDGRTIALRVVGVDQLQVPHGSEQWWDMARARDLTEFESILARLQIPMFTTVAADRDGHILALFGGQTPVRPSGDFMEWAGIQPGDTSELIWHAAHAYAELPNVVDPPSGWVQNSNCPPWWATWPPTLDPDAYPAYMAPRFLAFREQRAIRMLRERERHSLDDLLADKHSTRLELADRVLDELLAVARDLGGDLAPLATDALATWDRHANADSRGMALFMLWLRELVPVGDYFGSTLFAQQWDPADPLNTPRGLADPAGATAALETAARKLLDMAGALDAPWGDVLRLRLAEYDLPANGGPGDPFGIFRVAYSLPDDEVPAAVAGGDTFVLAVEFSDPPRAMALLSYGNASQPNSPHIGDQLDLFARQALRPVWRTRAEIEAHLEYHERIP